MELVHQNTELLIRKKHVDLHIKRQEQTTSRNTNNVHELDHLAWFLMTQSGRKTIVTQRVRELIGLAYIYTT
jgi:hypothetical protein